jgi:hypothetical protein
MEAQIGGVTQKPPGTGMEQPTSLQKSVHARIRVIDRR